MRISIRRSPARGAVPNVLRHPGSGTRWRSLTQGGGAWDRGGGARPCRTIGGSDGGFEDYLSSEWARPRVSSRFCIEVPAALRAVPGARRAITRFCEHLGLGRELADRIRLATTE